MDKEHSEVARIADLAAAGEPMVERLRRKAFVPESRKGLNVRFGIAGSAQLLGCSTNRIRMAEEDGRLPPPPNREWPTPRLYGRGTAHHAL